jgi:molybdopterin-containing oxidoreductase family iron-sulfur binding subunit
MKDKSSVPSPELVQIDRQRTPVYWRSIGEREFGPVAPGKTANAAVPGTRENTRRDFLAGIGLAATAATLAGCRAPTEYALPLMTASDQVIPGVFKRYATTCGACPSSCSLLVTQRDGRPIKVEGNDLSALFGGGTCATGQAALLSLYDDERIHGPAWKGTPVAWHKMDERIRGLLAAAQDHLSVVLLSSTLTSPSTLAIIEEWSRQRSNFRHVVYDPISFSAARAANAESFGRAVIPHYRFDRARAIVGLEADFLGTWLSPVEFSHQYAAGRNPEGSLSFHVQFESGVSVTGSNADRRVAVAPSEMGAVAVALLRRVAHQAGVDGVPEGADPLSNPEPLDSVAAALWRHRGESIVVSGVQDKNVQLVVNALNSLLGNYGRTVDLNSVSHQRASDDAAMSELVEQMSRGEVHTLMLYGVNPAYDYSQASRFVDGLRKVALSVSFSGRRDETSSLTDAICPDHHFLETWGDAEPLDNQFSLAQPLIAPLFDTRAVQDSLLKWSGRDGDYHSSLRAFWAERIFPRQDRFEGFDAFWDRCLENGVFSLPEPEGARSPSMQADWRTAARTLLEQDAQNRASPRGDRYELFVHETVAMRDGRNADNPWLQELPDPINKTTWGNVASISPGTARKLSLVEGDLIALKADGYEAILPVFIQPGQHGQTVAVALGYGRKSGRIGRDAGVNLFPLARTADGYRRYSMTDATLERTGRREALASTQNHFSMEGRQIALETSLEQFRASPPVAKEPHESLPTLWPDRPKGSHSWGMVIDVNACTGCSACVVACQVENNVPVVGKDQVRRARIMHWIRIDHYYTGSEDAPSSLHQPMMCQHCGNAPCETVCPVLATTTSSEGLNQQVYNRCIGTRYCANNCPYKVRRFNFYDYTHSSDFAYNMQSPLARMALNPDVVVRSRGVMEKCSLCVQRIQLAKASALQEGRQLADGDIQTACQQACPTKAIAFGDLADSNSRVSKLRQNPRFYAVLEDLGTRPAVGYLKKVRNNTGA